MNDVQMAKGLGWFSIALGVLQLSAGRRVSRALGLGNANLVRAVGAREIAAGLEVLAYPDNPRPVWNRVAGDVMDVAVLTNGILSGRRPVNAAWGLAFVLGAAVLDVGVATSLTRREQQALGTARRTRIAGRGGDSKPMSEVHSPLHAMP